MIEVHALTKRYGDQAAIENVTFDAKRGEILGFLGPNGAGKSTTMKILAGYMPASSGTAKVAGFDVYDHSLEARRNVGYLPENVPLYPEMTVRDYLGFMAEIKGVGRSERRASVNRSMEQARVSDRANWIIGKLSKGYRQRVGLAQALVSSPPVLILDEPTVGLDPRQIIETRNLIKGLGGDHTVILSTHILPEVSATCGRVVIISRGRVVAEDTPENLTRRLSGSERVEVDIVGQGNGLAERLRSTDGVIDVAATEQSAADTGRYLVDCVSGRDIRAEIASVVVGGGWSLVGLRGVGRSLEDVFLELTTTEEASEAETSEVAA